MKVVLIRHAEPHRGQGEKALEDYGLTERGKRQAEDIVPILASMKFDRILTSSLPRAIQTGNIIAERLEHPSTEEIRGLSEIGELGDFEDEPITAFFDRVRNTMNQIAGDSSYNTTLAVTHAGFIMGSIRALFDIPTPGTGARLEPNFTSLTGWSRKEDYWELSYFNLHGAT